jgi:hypothetical protein
MTSPRPRPNPAQWLWYAYGGRLPARYRDWVRHDNTAPTWALRHLARVLGMALPVLVVLFAVLTFATSVPPGITAGVLVVGLLIALFSVIGTARQFALVRLAKHGFPPDVTPPPSRLVPEDAWADPPSRRR